MLIIGDVHGLYPQYKDLLKKHEGELSIQIGDMGYGFKYKKERNPGYRDIDLSLPTTARWFRGNHDNPAESKAHPSYMGDYGAEEIEGHKVFWCGGAWSIDRDLRLEGVSWWPDEELTIRELYEVQDKYLAYRPEIMLTHDCPSMVTHAILNEPNGMYHEVKGSRTGQALSSMFREYQPKIWIFGHYHKSWERVIGDTTFICLKELEVRQI